MRDPVPFHDIFLVVGTGTRKAVARYTQRIAFSGAILRGLGQYSPGALALAFRQMVRQIRFTAINALPLVATLGIVIGGTVVLQAYAQAARFGMPDVPAKLLTVIVIHELGPLLTALVVLGRSGTAIAAELATNAILGETDGLAALGVDLGQYFVVPRIVGLSISVILLTLYLDALALLSGSLAASFFGGVALGDSLSALRLALTPTDAILTIAKAGIFGAGIAAISCFEGLYADRRSTDLPRAVTRSFVASLLFVFFVSASFTAVLYR